MSEQEQSKQAWFESWFDSPYYHVLYQNRDLNEATFFIQKLATYLHLSSEKVCDLACGKGRHALILSQLGLDVVGLDLAPKSIAEASKMTHERLRFAVHDMREVYAPNEFDVVFNLFTSFGYFDSQTDNLRVLESIHSMLKPKGRVVIDFMNAIQVVENLISVEDKKVANLVFHIKRNYDGNHIFKNIQFEDQQTQYDFTERVQALTHTDFTMLLEQSGFEVKATFGNYDLASFEEKTSPRLILIAEKK